ncbi:MAG: pantetheine-phosphate adenylyltransferase [Chthonomonadales bacterium]|nr:pantetheine-phosphate adenylyltransferase [Chthonomonadales bacterium]
MPPRYDAIVPGTFDPVTNGHLDIIERAAQLFPTVHVAVAASSNKSALFTPEERVAMLHEVCAQMGTVSVGSFAGLLVDYAGECGAHVIVRGLRAVSDFEYELQMAHTNRRLRPDLETVFVMTTTEYSFLSSSIVKQIARLGGPVEGLVPDSVRQRLRDKVGLP